MKLIGISLVILLVLLQYKLWFAEGSTLQAYQLRQQLLKQDESNEALRQRNAALEAEVFDLKQGTQSIEERARNEMGMIHQNEQFYQLIATEKTREKTREKK